MSLMVRLGQYSTAGQKAQNQDSYGACIPQGAALSAKGIVLAVADGISSSSVSQVASETAVQSFLQDYYCTSDAWSVPHSALQVVQACHHWLRGQNQNSAFAHEPDKGYVSTFTALILRQDQAFWLHVGDSRLYLFRQQQLQQLTRDHRIWQGQLSYLSQALGMNAVLKPEQNSLMLQQGDLLMLATDGLFDRLGPQDLTATLSTATDDLDRLAAQLAAQALAAGTDDNITLQLVRIDQLPSHTLKPYQQHDELPLPPVLSCNDSLDALQVVRVLQQNSRSFVYLVQQQTTGAFYVMKAPSTELAEQPQLLDKLLREEWIARRVQSQHLQKAAALQQPRSALYSLFDYVPGQSLRQWRLDHPQLSLEQVRQLIEQLGRALQTLHRAEILHQDLRPENVLIDHQGNAVLIDFGAARLAGLESAEEVAGDIPGTALYTAPEFFLGEAGTEGSDLYSLAVLSYHLLSGKFPYGPAMARCKTRKAQCQLTYQSVRIYRPEVPLWLDHTLRKALQPVPQERYQHLSEFLYDIRHPNPDFIKPVSLMQQHPLAFWQALCVLQLLVILGLVAR
ncbi:protein phosphatase 2C domain-containing protein [Rheinheimera sp.]|uniref:protein kinase domain-containing protein n=1 Tax=Rheinheimera sp. TaxID=1869214 RepID=UPI00307E3AE9